MDCGSCQCCERSIAKICPIDSDWIAIGILFLSLLLLLLLIFLPFVGSRRAEIRKYGWKSCTVTDRLCFSKKY